jgi:hypothetical protein
MHPVLKCSLHQKKEFRAARTRGMITSRDQLITTGLETFQITNDADREMLQGVPDNGSIVCQTEHADKGLPLTTLSASTTSFSNSCTR